MENKNENNPIFPNLLNSPIMIGNNENMNNNYQQETNNINSILASPIFNIQTDLDNKNALNSFNQFMKEQGMTTQSINSINDYYNHSPLTTITMPTPNPTLSNNIRDTYSPISTIYVGTPNPMTGQMNYSNTFNSSSFLDNTTESTNVNDLNIKTALDSPLLTMPTNDNLQNNNPTSSSSSEPLITLYTPQINTTSTTDSLNDNSLTTMNNNDAINSNPMITLNNNSVINPNSQIITDTNGNIYSIQSPLITNSAGSNSTNLFNLAMASPLLSSAPSSNNNSHTTILSQSDSALDFNHQRQSSNHSLTTTTTTSTSSIPMNNPNPTIIFSSASGGTTSNSYSDNSIYIQNLIPSSPSINIPNNSGIHYNSPLITSINDLDNTNSSSIYNVPSTQPKRSSSINQNRFSVPSSASSLDSISFKVPYNSMSSGHDSIMDTYQISNSKGSLDNNHSIYSNNLTQSPTPQTGSINKMSSNNTTNNTNTSSASTLTQPKILITTTSNDNTTTTTSDLTHINFLNSSSTTNPSIVIENHSIYPNSPSGSSSINNTNFGQTTFDQTNMDFSMTPKLTPKSKEVFNDLSSEFFNVNLDKSPLLTLDTTSQFNKSSHRRLSTPSLRLTTDPKDLADSLKNKKTMMKLRKSLDETNSNYLNNKSNIINGNTINKKTTKSKIQNNSNQIIHILKDNNGGMVMDDIKENRASSHTREMDKLEKLNNEYNLLKQKLFLKKN